MSNTAELERQLPPVLDRVSTKIVARRLFLISVFPWIVLFVCLLFSSLLTLRVTVIDGVP